MVLSETSDGTKFLIGDAPPSILSVDSKTWEEYLKNYVRLASDITGITLFFNPDRDILYIHSSNLPAFLVAIEKVYPGIERPLYSELTRLTVRRRLPYLAIDDALVLEHSGCSLWRYIREMGVQEQYIIIREYSGDLNPSSAQLISLRSDMDNSSILVEGNMWNAIWSVVHFLKALKIDDLGHPLPSLEVHYVKKSGIEGIFRNSAFFGHHSENQHKKTIIWSHEAAHVAQKLSHEAQKLRRLEKVLGQINRTQHLGTLREIYVWITTVRMTILARRNVYRGTEPSC
jgi:hypothetical protein